MSFSSILQEKYISTKIGEIAVFINEHGSAELPVIFLHGVYFDHHLWDSQVEGIVDRTTITVDMPFHGKSRRSIRPDWSLDDCADMLIDILDGLSLEKVIAVGHSWGSMTILLAANKYPHRFASIGLCNMPFLAASKRQKVIFSLQHTLLVFRDFYIKQAGKALFGKSSLRNNPAIINQLIRSTDILTNREIIHTDRAVIVNADDATVLIANLRVRAIALKGKEDYVPAPPNMETIVVGGGHISPLEKPQEVMNLINKLLD